MNRFVPLAACAALAAACAPALAQAPAVTLTPNPNNTFNNGIGFSIGFQFTTNSAVTVDALGYFTPVGIFTEDHEVGLYNGGGTLLASAIVTSASTSVANFRYADITDINLGAGQTYFVVGASGFVDPYTFLPLTFVTDPAINFVADVYEEGNALTFPASSGGIIGTFGPNFLLTPGAVVPEPGSIALLVGMASLGGLALRRRCR